MTIRHATLLILWESHEELVGALDPLGPKCSMASSIDSGWAMSRLRLRGCRIIQA